MADNEVRIVITGKDSGAAAALRDVRGEAEKTGASFSGLGKTAGIAAAAGGLAFAGMGAAVLKVGFDFNNMKQQAEIAFGTMLGDGQKAKDFLGDLQQFAAKTPFEFPELVQASQKMLAMGFAAGEVKPLLTAVGDAVAGLGGSSEQVGRVTTALGQMKAKGKVSAEEMMQLTEAGIPAWQMLADAIGVDVPAAMKLAEKGAIDADTAIAAIQTGMTTRFGGMMEKQSQTFGGVLSTLKDTFAQVSAQISGPLFEAATGALQRIAAFTSTPEFTAGVTTFTETLAAGFGGIADVAATIGPPIIDAIGQVVGFVQSNWPAVKDALVGVWSLIAPQAQAAFQGLQGVIDSLRPVVERVTDGVREAFGAVVSYVEERWPRIESFAREVFGKVKGAISEIASEIAPTLNQIVSVIERVVGEIGERWGQIEKVIAPVIQFAMDTVLNILDVAKNAILLVMNLIQGDWGAAWGNVKAIVGAVWDEIKSLISNSLDLIKGLIPLAMGLIKDALSLAWEGIQKAAELAWDGIKRGAEEGLKALVRVAQDLPGDIKKAVGDLSRLLWDTGTKIIQGLIDGIWEKVKALKDVLDRVTGMIPNWKGPLDKDRKLLYPAGVAIIDGLVDGIEDRLPNLREALEGVTDIVRQGGAAAGAAGAAAAAGAASGGGSGRPPLPPGYGNHPGEKEQGFGPGNIQGQCNYIMDVVLVNGVPTFCYELLGWDLSWAGMGSGAMGLGIGGYNHPSYRQQNPRFAGTPWWSGMPSFDIGGKVQKTGPILAHEGEIVLTKAEAQQYEDSAGSPALPGMSAGRFLPGGLAAGASLHGVEFQPRMHGEGGVVIGDSRADMIAAIAAGVAQGLTGAAVNLDGQRVGEIVANALGRDALLAGVAR